MNIYRVCMYMYMNTVIWHVFLRVNTWRAQILFTHNVPGMQKRARTPVLCSSQRQ